MSERSEFAADELSLKGRLQVEIALSALVYSGINIDAQKRLRTFLNVHDRMTDEQRQHGISIHLRGGSVEQDKKDISTGLEALCVSQTVSDDIRFAAQALREIL